MSTLTDIAATYEDQVLGTLKQGQDFVLDSLKQWSGVIHEYVPESLVSYAPDATELVDSAFSFAEKLLSSQRQFVDSVLKTVAGKADTPAS